MAEDAARVAGQSGQPAQSLTRSLRQAVLQVYQEVESGEGVMTGGTCLSSCPRGRARPATHLGTRGTLLSLAPGSAWESPPCAQAHVSAAGPSQAPARSKAV